MNQQKIIDALAGCDAQHPMDFAELHKRVGGTQKGLRAQLELMCYTVPATINRASITRAGITRVAIWPTCVVPAFGPRGIVITKPRNPTLPRPPRMGELSTALYVMVQEQPGISRTELIARALPLEGADVVRIKSALGNLTYKGKIVSTGRRHGSTYKVAA